MAREISVVFVSDAKPAFLSSVLVDAGSKLATVATRVAEKLAGAGVRAAETRLIFRRISEADAAALEADARHAPTSGRPFSKLIRVAEAFVEGSECVLVKLVGEWPARCALGRAPPFVGSRTRRARPLPLPHRRRRGGRGGGW